jgi:hypothetical protein
VQPGDKRVRAINVDGGGDERMHDACEDGSDGGGDWQVKGARRKGKGRVSASAVAAAVQSATASAGLPPPVGPLATLSRPGVAASSTSYRHPAVQQSGSGTPSTSMASGTLQSLSERVSQAATAAGPPAATPTPVISQQTAAQTQPTALDEPETPCMDSLPSTPRASFEEETPNPFAPVCTKDSNPSQEHAVLVAPPSTAATVQSASGSVPMEMDIGMEQHTLGPVTMPAPVLPAAATAESAQHVSGSVPQPGDGGSNQ